MSRTSRPIESFRFIFIEEEITTSRLPYGPYDMGLVVRRHVRPIHVAFPHF